MAKLTNSEVKRIRRRVRAGEHQTDLADEFGVNRKTIRRRLNALESVETERAERIAERRLRRQAEREKRKLLEREGRPGFASRRAQPVQRPLRAEGDAGAESVL